jgi:lipoprotein Spr
MRRLLFVCMWLLLAGCQPKPLTPDEAEHITHIATGKITPAELAEFACGLAGKPYKYHSADPQQGFDCSGFVTYVFNHFHILVPRTTADFSAVRREIPLKDAKQGDLIFFTGSDSTRRTAGHMGIISSLPGEPLRFMHAAMGGVRETDFHTRYFEARYLKTIRLFSQNDP